MTNKTTTSIRITKRMDERLTRAAEKLRFPKNLYIRLVLATAIRTADTFVFEHEQMEEETGGTPE
jgi:predicted DNA-binding protein